MPDPFNLLASAVLPRFFLLENLRENYSGINGFDLQDFAEDGVIVESFEHFHDAIRMVPRPVEPQDEALRKRLWDRHNKIDSVSYLEDPWLADRPYNEFDTDPQHNWFMVARNLPRDINVYGEGYTILWGCPADANAVATRLVAEAYRVADNAADVPSAPDWLERLQRGEIPPPRGRLTEGVLGGIWDQFISRMCFYQPGLSSEQRDQLYRDAVGTFRQTLGQQPWSASALSGRDTSEEMFWK